MPGKGEARAAASPLGLAEASLPMAPAKQGRILTPRELAAAFALVKKIQRDGAVLKRFRDYNADDGLDPSELLSKFREMHSRGTLSDTENRTIKTKLAAQIQSQALAARRPSDS